MYNHLKTWLPLAFVITIFCSLVNVAVQQDMRQSANDPQIQMAEDAAAKLSAGDVPASVLPPNREQINIATSLAPYIMVFDSSLLTLESSAVLDDTLPKPPAGVFDVAKTLGENRITWQPRLDVRSAIVVVPFTNKKLSGFVLVGRSLREVEVREANLTVQVAIAWMVAMVGSVLLIVFGNTFIYKKSLL